VASFWSNGLVPRGPGMGCHVAPCYWLLFKIYGVHGDRTPDLPTMEKLWQSPPCQRATHMFLVIYMILYIFKFDCFMVGRGSGLGLSPSPRSHIYYHMTTTLSQMRMHFSNGFKHGYIHHPLHPTLVALTIGLEP
jgi:hypothetical protein